MPTTTAPWIQDHNRIERKTETLAPHKSHKSPKSHKLNWRFIAFTAALTAAWFVTALVLVELVGR